MSGSGAMSKLNNDFSGLQKIKGTKALNEVNVRMR
jgi:hypothetical protein